jgi:hypothetical protein
MVFSLVKKPFLRGAPGGGGFGDRRWKWKQKGILAHYCSQEKADRGKEAEYEGPSLEQGLVRDGPHQLGGSELSPEGKKIAEELRLLAVSAIWGFWGPATKAVLSLPNPPTIAGLTLARSWLQATLLLIAAWSGAYGNAGSTLCLQQSL